MGLEKKHYLAIGATLLVITAAVVIYKRKKNNEKNNLPKTINSNSSFSNESNQELSTENSIFPLQLGSENKLVSVVQKYMNTVCPSSLKKVGVYPLEVNGVWDEKTEKASLACSVLKRNKISEESFNIIFRDLKTANLI